MILVDDLVQLWDNSFGVVLCDYDNKSIGKYYLDDPFTAFSNEYMGILIYIDGLSWVNYEDDSELELDLIERNTNRIHLVPHLRELWEIKHSNCPSCAAACGQRIKPGTTMRDPLYLYDPNGDKGRPAKYINTYHSSLNPITCTCFWKYPAPHLHRKWDLMDRVNELVPFTYFANPDGIEDCDGI